MTILAVDVGTSSIKTALVSDDGTVGRIVRGSTPSAQSGGASWLRSAAAACHEALDGSKPDAVVFSGNGPTVVPVDADGVPTYEPLMWHDDQSVERITGARSFFLQRIAWLYRQKPEAAEKTRWFLSCPEFFMHALSGEAVTVRPNERFTPFIWDGEQADLYGVEAHKLPPYVLTGDVTPAVADGRGMAWGLEDGVPLIAGGYDFLMSLVGTGTLRPGRTCDRAGTSEGINHCAARPAEDTRLRSLPHLMPDTYNVAGVLSSTGRLFEWFRSISGQKKVPYETMVKDILDRKPGSTPWFFPSLHQGANWEFASGMFIGLGAEHDEADMGRAVVESIGYAVRESVEMLGEAGFTVSSLRACGGQSRNSLWNQMKSDITGVPIEVPVVRDAELVGNAIAGFVGLGVYDRLDDAADRIVRIEERFEPNTDRYRIYTECFGEYCAHYAGFRIAFSEATSP
ncbi:MAG: carbohydrate kinase [Spirochaetaceae bacterium]|nr:MAG: carbohydrate kinase [Spirochaetaceae bacterium]